MVPNVFTFKGKERQNPERKSKKAHRRNFTTFYVCLSSLIPVHLSQTCTSYKSQVHNWQQLRSYLFLAKFLQTWLVFAQSHYSIICHKSPQFHSCLLNFSTDLFSTDFLTWFLFCLQEAQCEQKRLRSFPGTVPGNWSWKRMCSSIWQNSSCELTQTYMVYIFPWV